MALVGGGLHRVSGLRPRSSRGYSYRGLWPRDRWPERRREPGGSRGRAGTGRRPRARDTATVDRGRSGQRRWRPAGRRRSFERPRLESTSSGTSPARQVFHARFNSSTVVVMSSQLSERAAAKSSFAPDCSVVSSPGVGPGSASVGVATATVMSSSVAWARNSPYPGAHGLSSAPPHMRCSSVSTAFLTGPPRASDGRTDDDFLEHRAGDVLGPEGVADSGLAGMIIPGGPSLPASQLPPWLAMTPSLCSCRRPGRSTGPIRRRLERSNR